MQKISKFDYINPANSLKFKNKANRYRALPADQGLLALGVRLVFDATPVINNDYITYDALNIQFVVNRYCTLLLQCHATVKNVAAGTRLAVVGIYEGAGTPLVTNESTLTLNTGAGDTMGIELITIKTFNTGDVFYLLGACTLIDGDVGILNSSTAVPPLTLETILYAK